METTYNQIGKEYSTHRKADPRISDTIYNLLDLPTNAIVADVGAGTGNYSNSIAEKELSVFAIEPSYTMISQVNFNESVKWIQGSAEEIPLKNNAVDGIFVILALHHFRSIEKALNEFNRICNTGSIVIFTFDPRLSSKFWLNDYFPSIRNQAFDFFKPVDKVASELFCKNWKCEILPFPLPSDLLDRFMAFGWKYPEVYLDETVRKSISAFALAEQEEVERGIHNLRKDIENGMWDAKYGEIKEKTCFDCGYRFILLKRK